MTDDDSFDLLFEHGTGYPPFPFQRRLAAMNPPPELLRAPTGSGKTQAVLLAWLWQRRFTPDREARRRTPRRLVYVLPMRTLVEQTRQVAEEVLKRLALADSIHVYPLLGGDTDDEWYRFPERDAILVGTQDMVLSRALNRGYALSRFAWPRAFALLHNDAYWVLDEVQLMGSGLASSTQLAGLRAVLGTTAPVWSTWMSATAEPSWLCTVDHARPAPSCAFPWFSDHGSIEARASRSRRRPPLWTVRTNAAVLALLDPCEHNALYEVAL